MINTLKSLLENALPLEDIRSEDLQSDVKIAAAALMVEVMVSDYDEHPEEKPMLKNLLEQQFSLSKHEAESLLDEALTAHVSATDYFHFTRDINRHYSMAQKISLIESLWRMAYADNELQAVEQHVIRRIANLLYVSHSDFIAAKLKVTGH